MLLAFQSDPVLKVCVLGVGATRFVLPVRLVFIAVSMSMTEVVTLG